MREFIYVQFLTNLKVIVETIEDKRLMLLEASGFSKDGQVGIPQLIPRIEERSQLNDNILEFDFKIMPSELTKIKQLEWNIKVVFDLEKLPDDIKGIKVRAGNNADIFLLETTN